jgi:hypothetical protein
MLRNGSLNCVRASIIVIDWSICQKVCIIRSSRISFFTSLGSYGKRNVKNVSVYFHYDRMQTATWRTKCWIMLTVLCFLSECSHHRSSSSMSRGPCEGMYMWDSIRLTQKVTRFALTCGLHFWKEQGAHVFIKLLLSPDQSVDRLFHNGKF